MILDTPAVKLRIGRREVNVSNPDKVFFPKRRLKKLDLVNYYLDVAPHVLNHVQRRPMQMLRYPDGAEEWFFYQKRVPANHPDWLETVHIKFPSGRTADFPVCNEAAALAWIVNLGCIDLHTWASRVDDVDRPDRLLIDLDPSEGNPWRHVRKIAMVVKEVMDELGLASFPKTSGATGLHILAPIKPELGFPEVRRFAKALAQEVERRIDDQEVATTTWKVADRRGVFVDFGQNSRDRTIASAYSIRPTPDARASAPLSWDEVPTVKPERFTLTTMRKRIDEVGDLTPGCGGGRGACNRSSPSSTSSRRIRRSSTAAAVEPARSAGKATKAPTGANAAAPSSRGLSRGAMSGARHRTSLRRTCLRRYELGAARSDSTVGSPRRRGGRTWRHVHCSGSLSGRKRMNLVPWRKRFFSSLS